MCEGYACVRVVCEGVMCCRVVCEGYMRGLLRDRYLTRSNYYWSEL